LVMDNGGAQQQPGEKQAPVDAGTTLSLGTTRMRASALANRSMTVPQGYLIPAVLETGFDSTKPGFARAIVTRDVRGFDGKNVLIPRGSRLVGQYQAAVAQGQNRAVITWTRLIRPDGMTITMDSPAVDTVGRGGVAASVNTHFLARLGDSFLQTTVQLGQVLAGRSVTGPVVVLQGNAAAAASQAVAPSAGYVPTLRVPPGKTISVFVAHDLDFSAAGGAR
jgi:type IV secretion system protein VirB10